MKLRTLVAITLVGLGCSFASAQTGTFSFFTADSFELCDFLVITYNSGGVVAGYENLTEPQQAGGCELSENAAVVGFVATTHKGGQPAWGKGSVIGDAIYDATCDCYSGLQWTLWFSGKVSKKEQIRPLHRTLWLDGGCWKLLWLLLR